MKKIIYVFTIVVTVLAIIVLYNSSFNYASEEENLIPIEVKNIRLADDPADEIVTTGPWINSSEDLTLEKLKGKVVLLEFWTFGCYNCTNTVPHLNEWYKKYKDKGLEIIGIHCPEFDYERDVDNIKDAVKDLEIKYPVLIDNNFNNWYKYDVHAWPTIFVIDKNGVERYKKVGEKGYKKTEEVITTLLSEKSNEDN